MNGVVYVEPNKFEAAKKRMTSMPEPFRPEVKAVDMNYAYVPMGPLSQKDKESQEHLMKTAACNDKRFGLSEGGEY